MARVKQLLPQKESTMNAKGNVMTTDANTHQYTERLLEKLSSRVENDHGVSSQQLRDTITQHHTGSLKDLCDGLVRYWYAETARKGAGMQAIKRKPARMN